MQIRQHLLQYAYLMRLDKPIGILLLLWPTLWALFLAGNGHPALKNILIFMLGVVIMRSAGCVLNDYLDRNIDCHVARTRDRPLAAGKVKPYEAIILLFFLALGAFILVLFCNPLTLGLAFIGAAIVSIYPTLKRITYLPQVGLGLAFTWGVPMAFAAETGTVPLSAWFLFLTGTIWPIIYDTMYAMVDREDDKKIGVKSTALLFADMDTLIIALLQVLFIVLLIIVGLMFQLHSAYYMALVMVSLFFIYQQWLIRKRENKNCFNAFLNNNWVGLTIYLGILLSFSQ